jgi:hypothetical protein
MRKLLHSAVLLLALIGMNPSHGEELWKGKTEVPPYEFGLLTGMGLFGTETSWSFLGTAAYLIKPEGLVDEVDERMWAEMEIGPSFYSGSIGTGLQYSTHLRWDFTYNEHWTAYALAGVSGFVLPSGFGSKFSFHPRFGAGIEYQTKTPLMFRGELSAEFIGLGIALNF